MVIFSKNKFCIKKQKKVKNKDKSLFLKHSSKKASNKFN